MRDVLTMAREITHIIRSSTRSEIDAAASSNLLLTGEMILVTDEDTILVATSTSAYIEIKKESDL